MKVTSVRLSYTRSPSSPVKAYAKIILDDELIITGIRVLDNITRSIRFPDFYTDPVYVKKDFKFVSIVNPITTNLRKHIEDSIFEYYDNDKRNPINVNK